MTLYLALANLEVSLAINWSNIKARIAGIVEKLTEQNFRIDVAHTLLQKIQYGLSWRSDVNIPVIAAYWAEYIFQHHKLNNFEMKVDAVLFEEEYYSYINILDLVNKGASTGTTTYIVDFITDSTDLKRGEDIDDWVIHNDFFKDAMKAIWMTDVLGHWIAENRLVTRKRKVIRLEDYWNYEDYIYTIRVWNPELNIIIVFLLGTHDKY